MEFISKNPQDSETSRARRDQESVMITKLSKKNCIVLALVNEPVLIINAA